MSKRSRSKRSAKRGSRGLDYHDPRIHGPTTIGRGKMRLIAKATDEDERKGQMVEREVFMNEPRVRHGGYDQYALRGCVRLEDGSVDRPRQRKLVGFYNATRRWDEYSLDYRNVLDPMCPVKMSKRRRAGKDYTKYESNLPAKLRRG